MKAQLEELPGHLHSGTEGEDHGAVVQEVGQQRLSEGAGGVHAQEAGCCDQEHRKCSKVIGHRPPHTRQCFFLFKKSFFSEINKKNHVVFHFLPRPLYV